MRWLLLPVLLLPLLVGSRRPPVAAFRQCEPYADHCRACKDCSKCYWCSVKGGRCSVCLEAKR